jgi:hypothetical protein
MFYSICTTEKKSKFYARGLNYSFNYLQPLHPSIGTVPSTMEEYVQETGRASWRIALMQPVANLGT